MQSHKLESSDVAIFWDYENCHASSQVSGYEVVSGIRNVAHRFGPVKHFKAYMEIPDVDRDTFRSFNLRSELQSSGVSLTDCPHNGKNAADMMIMVDMLAYAMDHPAPATLILISGDRDFAYVVAILRLRRYEVVVISLMAHISLKSQASECLDWNVDVMGFSASSSHVDGRAESPTTVRNPSNLQSPNARRSSYLPSPESTFSRARQSTSKHGPAATVPNEASPAVPANELVVEHPPYQPAAAAPAQPEATSVPAPAYSRAESAPVPTLSSFVLPTMSVAPTTASTSAQAQPSPLPIPASPAPFPEDLVAAHIQRCMEMAAEVQPLASQFPQAGPFTHANMLLPTPKIGDVAAEASRIPETGPSARAPPKPTIGVMTAQRSQIPEAGPSVHANMLFPTSTIPTAVQLMPKTVPAIFKTLVECLEQHRAKGISRPLRGTIALDIIKKEKQLYQRAGVERFSQYSALAEKEKIVTLGGNQGSAWISLHPDWCK
ncbi:NYN domain-containing protein [Mycena capillaripes]|nr:NYN domain-containing protein [Mycena capillaripes]